MTEITIIVPGRSMLLSVSLFQTLCLHFLWLSLNKQASSSGKKWAQFYKPVYVSLCMIVHVNRQSSEYLFNSFASAKKASVIVCMTRSDIYLPTESAACVHYFIFKSLKVAGSCSRCACLLGFTLLFFASHLTWDWGVLFPHISDFFDRKYPRSGSSCVS